jgi:hypothetical protein
MIERQVSTGRDEKVVATNALIGIIPVRFEGNSSERNPGPGGAGVI